jgi:hypothetical protein
MNLPFDFRRQVLHFHKVASELCVAENYHLTGNLGKQNVRAYSTLCPLV